MAEVSNSIEERLLSRGALFAAMVGLPLALLAAYPLTLGVFLGLLLSRGRIRLLAVVVVAYGAVAYLRAGWTLSPEGFVDYAASQAQGMANLAVDTLSLVWEYREASGELLGAAGPVLADSRALSAACVPLLCLSVPVGVLLGVVQRRRRRAKTAAGTPTKAGASTAATKDRPPSTVHTPHGPSPRKAEAIWKPDGGLPPGLGEGPVTRYVVGAPWRFRIRYRVAQGRIVGTPVWPLLESAGGWVLGGLAAHKASLTQPIRDVVVVRSQEQVPGVDAGRRIAAVEDAGAVVARSGGDRPVVEFPGDAVGGKSPSPEFEDSVAAAVEGTGPEPAPVRGPLGGQLRPESGVQGNRRGRGRRWPGFALALVGAVARTGAVASWRVAGWGVEGLAAPLALFLGFHRVSIPCKDHLRCRKNVYLGPPRYRVLHAKGGVGGLFTRFRRASIHGNEDLHGTDTQFWAPSYTVTALTRWERVQHVYQVAHSTVFRSQVGQASVYTNAAPQTHLRSSPRAGSLASVATISPVPGPGAPTDPHPTEPVVPGPGQWGPDGQLGSVSTLMAPPKTGKTRLDVDVHAAIISGGTALGWQAGLSGVLWLVEESESVFREKRSETLRLASSATGSTLETPDRPLPSGSHQDGAGDARTDGGALPPLAERLVCLYGPGRPVGLPQLAVYLAEAIQAARLLEARYGIPYRAITLDSLFFWVPDAETDATTAGRCMALFKSAAALGYAVRIRTHADPESGRQKGPMRLWSQTDYRVALTPEPRKTPPESTPNRRLVFTGRYADGARPPDVLYTLSGDGLDRLPGKDAAARLSHLTPLATTPDKPAPIVPTVPTVPQVPSATSRFLAALPPEGAALTELAVPGWSRSMVYKVASDLRKRGVLVESKGLRGKLTLMRAGGNHSAAPNEPPSGEPFAPVV